MSERKNAKANGHVILLDTEYHRVRLAIDRLYVVFASYPAPKSLEISPLNDRDKMFRMLNGQPLSALWEDDLGAYAFSALYTAGDDRDYRHFLPRILDLALRPSGQPGLSPPVIAGKLDYAGWRAWPSNEIDCIESFFAFAWAFALSSPPDLTEATDWLAGMARARMEVGGALKTWESAKSHWAWLTLARFVLDRPKRFRETGLVCGGYWSEVDSVAIEEISLWLRSPSLADGLLRAGIEMNWPDDASPELLAAAADLLDELRDRFSDPSARL